MSSYEILDKVSDSYTPLLGVVWLAVVGCSMFMRRWRQAFLQFAFGLVALLVAYCFMWVDAALSLWASMGLDYSTHAAVALALATTICTSSRRLRFPVALSVPVYFLLMLYQQYHTIGDIAATTTVVAVPLIALAYFVFTRLRLETTVESAPSILLK